METCTIEATPLTVTVSWNGICYEAIDARGERIDGDKRYESLHARLAQRGIEAEDCHTLEATRNLEWHPRTYRAIHPSDQRR